MVDLALLRHAAAVLHAHARAEADEDAERMAVVLDGVANGGDFLELLSGDHKRIPHSRSLPLQLVYRRRDELVRETVEKFFAGSLCQAAEFSKKYCEYRAAGWLRDGQHVDWRRPAGSLDHALWQILKMRDVSLGKRSVHEIILKN